MPRLLLLLLVLLLPLMPIKASEYDLSPLQEMALSVQELEPLISEAQRNTDRAERFRFDYKNLISDLAIIHTGLIFAATGQQDTAHKVRSLFIQYGTVGNTAEAKYLSLLKHELQRLKNRALLLASHPETSDEKRMINYQFIGADFSSMIDAITVSLSGSGDRPRQFPALGGGNL
jgi:RAQPRD family integrative conjugative element protein